MRNRWFLSMVLLVAITLLSLTTETFAASILVKEGSRGQAVRRVQTLLIEQGWLDDSADGICGARTVAAIKAFQQANGLETDGICGDGTYLVLSGGEEYDGPEEGLASRGGGRVIYVDATAYSAEDPGNSCYTATGTLVRYGVIAVDPSVIPLGTHVYIPGYGEAVAEDIGWAIQGNRIDVAFDTHAEALSFGRQDLEIYIRD